MTDHRTTTKAEPSTEQPGHFLITCDDASTFTSRSFIDSPEGVRVVGSAPDGSVATDGPILTDDVRAQFVALGVEGIPVHTAAPAEYVAEATAETPPAEPAPIPMGAGLVLTQEEHQESRSIMDRIEGAIPEFIRTDWIKLRALLGHL